MKSFALDWVNHQHAESRKASTRHYGIPHDVYKCVDNALCLLATKLLLDFHWSNLIIAITTFWKKPRPVQTDYNCHQ